MINKIRKTIIMNVIMKSIGRLKTNAIYAYCIINSWM